MKLKTRLRSTGMRVLGSQWFLERQRYRARRSRARSGEAPVVRFFHQVDDPYSHLALQKLSELIRNYHLPFRMHLVSGPAETFMGSPDHFADWALRDAGSIAAAYQTTLPGASYPDPERVAIANALVAAMLDADDFADQAATIGTQLWSGQCLPTPADLSAGASAVAEGNQLRKRLGHYFGGMFHFEGEWFWGIDRIRALEARLQQEGFTRKHTLCVPEPTPTDTTGLAASHVTLEYFPSLRSPYTAVGHQRVLDLAVRSGVNLVLRPVMPMMMRGVPAPRAKQRYIIMDAAREARARGVPFGHFVDPFGDPVKRAFALFPGAVELGRGMEFVTAYLSAAWAEGVDISREKGLRRVANRAGLDWDALTAASAGKDWEGLLEANVNDMLTAGLWGVPSFRVSGGDRPRLACWGQDRIWLLENEIASRCIPRTANGVGE